MIKSIVYNFQGKIPLKMNNYDKNAESLEENEKNGERAATKI